MMFLDVSSSVSCLGLSWLLKYIHSCLLENLVTILPLLLWILEPQEERTDPKVYQKGEKQKVSTENIWLSMVLNVSVIILDSKQ